jgi:ABC-2 type transport system permease protein
MSKFFVVMKREYAQVVKKKSFIIMTILTPVIMAAFMVLPAFLAQRDVASSVPLAIIDQTGNGLGQTFAEAVKTYKLGDTEKPSYLVNRVAEVKPGDSVALLALQDTLTRQIEAREIDYLLIIRPDAHLTDSSLQLVTNSDDYQSINRFEYELTRLLSKQRLAVSHINLPVDSVLFLTRRVNLETENTSGESIPPMLKFFVALVFVMLMYIITIFSGQGLMRAVIEEKSGHIVEVLVSSVSPFQLMAGKILGGGTAALTQIAIWVIAGLIVFVITGLTGMAIDPALAKVVFNPIVVLFFSLFFVSGYLMYCTLFALVGSIVNSDKEAQNFVFLIIIWMLPALMAGTTIMRDPYADWVLMLSYFPLCTPTLMFERVAFLAPSATQYSLFSGILGEATLGFLIVVLATILIAWITSRVFRIGILMYGKRPTLPEILRWARHS